MTARIVFADGSKAMAYNLCDLYERWLIKQDIYRKVKTTRYTRRVKFVDYTNPQHLEQANQMKEELTKRVADLQKLLGDKRFVDELGFDLKPLEYQAYRNALKDELEYVMACKRALKDVIRDMKVMAHDKLEMELADRVREITREDGDIWFIEQAYELILHLKKKHGIELETDEGDILGLLKRRLGVWKTDY